MWLERLRILVSWFGEVRVASHGLRVKDGATAMNSWFGAPGEGAVRWFLALDVTAPIKSWFLRPLDAFRRSAYIGSQYFNDDTTVNQGTYEVNERYSAKYEACPHRSRSRRKLLRADRTIYGHAHIWSDHQGTEQI